MPDAPAARAGVWCAAATGYRDVAARARSRGCRCLPKGGPRELPLVGAEDYPFKFQNDSQACLSS